MSEQLATFAIQARHLVNLADQLRRNAKALNAELAFTSCSAHLEGIHTLGIHVAEAARERVAQRIDMEKRANLTAADLREAAADADEKSYRMGGDICARCGTDIDHNEPHVYCGSCGEG